MATFEDVPDKIPAGLPHEGVMITGKTFQATAPDFPAECYFTNQRGDKLFAKYWVPQPPGEKPIRGILFHCHGFAEYCDHAYHETILSLVEKHIMVFAHDHTGHGRSSGRLRGYVSSFEYYTDDVIYHMQLVRKKFEDAGLTVPPCFILGHSMGGLIAAHAGCVLRPDLFSGGVILTAPALAPDPVTATPGRLMAARVLSRIAPWVGVGRLQGKLLCSDEAALERMKNDPLIYRGPVRARWGAEMLNAMVWLADRSSKVTAPLLILHGDADLICALGGSQEFHDRVASTDKQLVVYKGALHRVMEEPSCKVDYNRCVAEWVDSRCQRI